MPVRDVLWACPVCQTAGGIRKSGRREQCVRCGARYRRGAGARIVAEHSGGREDVHVADWLRRLGPIRLPEPGPGGTILGPEPVRVKRASSHAAVRWAGELLGFMEVYGGSQPGFLTLREDGLGFRSEGGSEVWPLEDITAVMPASSAIQIGFGPGDLRAVRFVDGSVRLWTRAIQDVLSRHYAARGLDLTQTQPCLRTCAAATRGTG